MLTFKQFLSESRAKEVGAKEFIEWCEAHASKYLAGGKYFYRGSKTAPSGLSIGTSVGETPRRSANGAPNNYTLWIDNDPAFKDFPKRSRSWIASDRFGFAGDYGKVSLLIIEDSAMVGKVHEDDIWFKMLHEPTGTTVSELNSNTSMILKAVGEEQHPASYEELSKSFKVVTLDSLEEMLDGPGEGTTHNIRNERAKALVDLMYDQKVSNLFDLWKKLLKPELFGLTTAGDVHEESTMGEVWVEGAAAFIPLETEGDMSSEDRKLILQWLSKYEGLENKVSDAWGKYTEDL